MTPQQYKRMIDDYNRKVQQHNNNVKRQIEDYNRKVKQHNEQVNRQIDNINRENKRAHDNYNRQIQNYNRQVTNYNNQQRVNRQNLLNAINKFNQSARTHTTVIYRTSVQNLETNYHLLEDYNQRHYPQSSLLTEYSAQETSNSLQLYNSVMEIDSGDILSPSDLQKTVVEEQLYRLSPELGKRWAGAIYSLNPNNPDASRHFCTSVREIFIQLINIKAPDKSVMQAFPNCTLHEGRPARREKIRYMLLSQSMSSQPMISFVDADVDDLLLMFRHLNDGTHGSAGTFTVQQLLKLKKRAEDSIIFLTSLNDN